MKVFNHTKRFGFIILASLLTFSLAACDSAPTTSPNNAGIRYAEEEAVTTEIPYEQRDLIKIGGYYGTGGITTYDPLVVADKLGYFKTIRIEDEDIQAGPNALAALVANRIQASHLQISISTPAIARGSGLRVVAAAHGGENTSNFHFYVPNDSPIKTVEDLKGKKVGGVQIGDSTYYALSNTLAKSGITIEDLELVTVPAGQTLQILEGGQLDGAGCWSDFEYRPIEERGGYRLLFTVFDILPPGLIHCGLTVNGAWLDSKPEQVRELVEGFVKANTWLQEHVEEGKQLHIDIAKERGLDPTLIEKYYTPVDIRPYSLTDDLDVEYFLYNFEKNGVIEPGLLKPSDIYTNEFNPFEWRFVPTNLSFAPYHNLPGETVKIKPATGSAAH
ncbi:MAG: ABC transporter substrate-binding protein [Peptococcaceae bacterium]|jgi:ABC-type nitrate/sulfonate/bicarbonate transport system substrate-binding protein|nr:ABC transporter substrate-binding protein [Peptococcaceae bacterium]